MKRVMSLAILFGLLFLNFSYGQSGLIFGVKPGNTINTAYLGLGSGKIIPIVGADLMWISVSAKYSDENNERYYDPYYNINYRYKTIETDKLSASAFLVVPHFGLKMFMGTKDVKPYLFGNVFLSIPSVSAESKSKDELWEYENDQLMYHYVDSESEAMDKETEELVEDILSFWGITFGAGAEYFFSENFSIGGEFGIRLIFDKIEYGDKDSGEYGQYESYSQEWNTEVNASFRMSYAVFSLNYYFK